MKKIPKKVQEIRDYKATREAGSKSISFSQLSLYRSCPKRWYRAYVLNEAPYQPSIHAMLGTSVHETLQRWLDIFYNHSVKEATEFDMNTYLLERMKVNYDKDRKSLGKEYSTSAELMSFYEDGKAILDYFKKHRSLLFSSKNTFLVGCEIPILYKLRDGFYFKGFIDACIYDADLDKWKIIDFKVTTSGWNAETKGDKLKTDQILLYRHFLSEQFGIELDKIDAEYVIFKRKIMEDAEFPAMRKRIQEFIPNQGPRCTKRAVGEVTTFCNDVLTESGNYQDKDYLETPSEKSCKWCLFRSTCKSAV